MIGRNTLTCLMGLAALVVALATRASTPTAAAPPPSRWADPSARMRQPLRPGPGALPSVYSTPSSPSIQTLTAVPSTPSFSS